MARGSGFGAEARSEPDQKKGQKGDQNEPFAPRQCRSQGQGVLLWRGGDHRSLHPSDIPAFRGVHSYATA